MRVNVVDAATTRALRRAVLRPGWPTGAAMHGDDNPDAVHLAAVDDDQAVVGACLVLPRPYPLHPDRPRAWQLRGMATAPHLQARGIGGEVLAAAVAEVRGRGARLIWCEARSAAVPFYLKHDFEVEGPEFEHAESGLPHRRMWRALD